MVNIISTTTPTANAPRAMTLQALKQRQDELAAQQAQVSKPHEVTSPYQGVGDVLNSFFTARRGDYLQGQENATRDRLAQMRAGWGPEGPTQAQAAEYSTLDPEFGNKISEDVMKAAQDKATQDRLFGFEGSQNALTRGVTERGQDITQQGNVLSAQTTQRGQDITAGTAANEQGVQTRGQDIAANTAANEQGVQTRGQDIVANTAAGEQGVQTRGQDVVAKTAANEQGVQTRGQDVVAKTAANEQGVQTRGQDIVAGTAADRLAYDKASNDWKQAHPDIQSVPQARAALEAGQFGQPGSKEAQDLYNAVVEKLTYIAPTGMSTSIVDKDGNTVTFNTGGAGGGRSGTGGGAGGANTRPGTLADYQKAAADAVGPHQHAIEMGTAAANAGPTGPYIGPAYGLVANMMNIGSKGFNALTGADVGEGWKGQVQARTALDTGALQGMLGDVHKLPGSISNKEDSMLMGVQPGTGKFNDENLTITGIAERASKNAMDRGRAAELYFANHQGSMSGFDERWAQFLENHPIIQVGQNGGIDLAPQDLKERAAALDAVTGGGPMPWDTKSSQSGGGGGQQPPDAAVAHLKANPNLAQAFDQKYGAGAAAKILGGR